MTDEAKIEKLVTELITNHELCSVACVRGAARVILTREQPLRDRITQHEKDATASCLRIVELAKECSILKSQLSQVEKERDGLREACSIADEYISGLDTQPNIPFNVVKRKLSEALNQPK